MGYVVLYTNPRGSTSYGAEFGNLIHHAYPGDDFYDMNSGVDAVIAKGYIDTNNLFVTGGKRRRSAHLLDDRAHRAFPRRSRLLPGH